jgi:TonB-linked SusC/RagA family outer membrane protein
MVLAGGRMAHGQAQRLTGRVIDETTREPIASAAVTVPGTTVGVTATDSGTFVLQVPTDAKTVQVRRIGYLEKIIALSPGQSRYEVALQRDVLHLEAQVVTGIATSVSTKSAANDVAVVNTAVVNEVPAPTVENSIQGQVPGALIQQNNGGAPGGGMMIQIRGITSINASASPLYVVDGVIVDNSTTFPGANAITNSVGSSGPQGVAPQSTDLGVNRIADINPDDIESIEVLKGASASAIYGSKASSGVIVITTKRGTSGKAQWQFSQKVGHFSDAQFVTERKFPTLASAQAWGALYGHSSAMIAANYAGPQSYQDQLFGNSQAAYETDLSVSGTQGGTQYFVSGLAKYDNGVLNYTGYNKQSVRSNITQRFTDNFNVTANLFYSHSVTVRGITGNDNNGSSPYDFLSYTPQFVRLNQVRPDGSYPDNPFGPANAFADAALIQTPEAVNRFIGGGAINWTPWQTEHQRLQISAIGGADYSDLRDNLFAPPSLQLERLTTPLPGISTTQNANTQYLNYSINVIHDFTGLRDFDFTTSAGFQRERRDLWNPATVSQNLLAGANSPAIGTVQTNFFTQTAQRDQSFYAQEQIVALSSRLTVTGGVTAERTTNDGDIGKFYAYPRYSAAYRIPQFVGFLDELKVRAAYGAAGTQPLYGVRYTPLQPNLASGLPGLADASTLGDPNIKPESSTEIETGFDATMFRSRASFNVTLYQKRITNLLLRAGVPPSVGYSETWVNGGEFTNQGIEVGLSATPVQLRNGFTWETTESFYRNYSVINALPVAPFGIGCCGGPFGLYFASVGRSVSQIVNTGAVTPNGSLVQVGDGQPSYVMSFNNAVSYAGFRLSGTLDWYRGGNVINITDEEVDFGPDLGDSAVTAKRLTGFFAGQTPYVLPGGFLKLRSVALSYSLPGRWVTQIPGIHFTSARLSLTGRNLWHSYAKGYDGVDPETNTIGATNISRNVEITPYPPAKSFFLSLDLGF